MSKWCKIVFTNGCFDIVHRGHIALLEYCSSIGEVVVVGLNSDESIRRNKGPSRPINNHDDRKYLLESIKYVDEVVIFEEDTPLSLIKLIKPDILVKGGDWKKEDIIGGDLCEVRIFNYVDGYSTTQIIKNINNR